MNAADLSGKFRSLYPELKTQCKKPNSFDLVGLDATTEAALDFNDLSLKVSHGKPEMVRKCHASEELFYTFCYSVLHTFVGDWDFLTTF